MLLMFREPKPSVRRGVLLARTCGDVSPGPEPPGRRVVPPHRNRGLCRYPRLFGRPDWLVCLCNSLSYWRVLIVAGPTGSISPWVRLSEALDETFLFSIIPDSPTSSSTRGPTLLDTAGNLATNPMIPRTTIVRPL